MESSYIVPTNEPSCACRFGETGKGPPRVGALRILTPVPVVIAIMGVV
jgi:hypothetical protein